MVVEEENNKVEKNKRRAIREGRKVGGGRKKVLGEQIRS